MKKTYKLLGLLVFVLAFTLSCENDDESIGEPVIPEQTAATASLEFNDLFYGPGGTGSYSVILNGTSEVDRQATLSSTFGTTVTTSTATIPQGATTGEGIFTVPSAPIPNLSFNETAQIEFPLIGVRMGEITTDEEGVESFTASGGDTAATTASTPITIYDRAPEGDAGGLNILVDWNDPVTTDLDLEVIDAAFTAFFGTSRSGTRYESVLFDSDSPDQQYVIYLEPFEGAELSTTVDTDVRFFIIDNNNNKTLLELTLPAGLATDTRTPVAIFTKSTVDGEAVYSDIALL